MNIGNLGNIGAIGGYGESQGTYGNNPLGQLAHSLGHQCEGCKGHGGGGGCCCCGGNHGGSHGAAYGMMDYGNRLLG